MSNPDKSPKKTLLLFTLLFAALYTFSFLFLLHFVPAIFQADELKLAQAVFTFSIAAGAGAGFFTQKVISKSYAIYAFVVCAPLLSLLMILLPSLTLSIACTIVVGATVGMAQLSFLTSFWKRYGANEDKGRISGIIVVFSLPIYLFIAEIFAGMLDIVGVFFLSLALCIIVLAVGTKITSQPLMVEGNYPEKRTIFLYAIPWIGFSIINATIERDITAYVLQITPSFFMMMAILQTIGGVVGAFIGGLIADHYGRRSALAISITLSGFSMALSGITQNSIALYVSFLANGLGWGVLLTLYIFVIWSDLSNKENCTRMFAIGLVTYFSATGLVFIVPTVDQSLIMTSALIGCSIIFLLNILIVLAPELATFEYREKARFKKFVKKVQEVSEDLRSQE